MYAGGLVILCCGALVGGIVRRDQLDLGSSKVVLAQTDWRQEHLLASTEPQNFEVSEDSYFSEMTSLLKKEYVDPVTDESKLATGAIRGMVSSLRDVNSFYMDADEFAVYKNAAQGKLTGIGADFALHLQNPQQKTIKRTPTDTDLGEPSDGPSLDEPATAVPILLVTAVAPDGPAAKAGVQPGDSVEAINGNVIISPKFVKEIRALQQQAAGGKLTSQQIFDLNQKFQDKVRTALMPWKAKNKLMAGDSGTLTVTFARGGATYTRQLSKSTSSLPAVALQADGSLKVRFLPGVADKLREAIEGKSNVVLDLRGGGTNSFTEMKKALAVVAPDGVYGKISTKRKGGPVANLNVSNGNSRAPKLTLVVDRTTRGAAETFALALSSRGRAVLQGEKMPGIREVVEVVSLPDGSGYTLVTGIFEPITGDKGASK